MRAILLLIALAGSAGAQTLEAVRTVRSQQVLTAEDVRIATNSAPGALSDPADAIGLETRTTLYAGRPIRPEDLGPPAVVERNQIVPLEYRLGGLTITAQGRALARAGSGEVIRALNLESRTAVNGRVTEDGRVLVGSAP